jgi:hypothetical protein
MSAGYGTPLALQRDVSSPLLKPSLCRLQLLWLRSSTGAAVRRLQFSIEAAAVESRASAGVALAAQAAPMHSAADVCSPGSAQHCCCLYLNCPD